MDYIGTIDGDVLATQKCLCNLDAIKESNNVTIIEALKDSSMWAAESTNSL